MEPEQNLRPIKLLVVSLGLLLIGGAILLATLVAQKKPGAECEGVSVDMKGRGALIASIVEGKQARLTFKNRDGMEFVTIDLCSGKITGTLAVKADPAR